MHKKMFLFLVLFAVVIFFSSESLSYAQPPNPPGPKGGPGAGQRRDRDNNPPGPAGGSGTNWENPPGPAGGPGASPDRRPIGNPPGPVGGPGTDWGNPPGPVGGPGASPGNVQVPASASATVPDALKSKAIVNEPWEKKADLNKDGIVDKVEMQQWKRTHRGHGNNPPGPAGGPGRN